MTSRIGAALAVLATLTGGATALNSTAEVGSSANRTQTVAADSLQSRSTAADRRSVALTVYNQGFGLVREVRDVNLHRGRVALEFADVASGLQTETVRVVPVGGSGRDLRVLEQNYRFDLLNPQKLLEKYVGRTVTIYRWNQALEREEALSAEVLSANGGTIFRIGDEITFNSPGRIAFPEIPDDLIATPSLVWLVDSPSEQVRLDVSYITGGMSWKSDYVMVLNEDDDRADLTGWVTLNNTSGATYENAELKLVAGDVQRVSGGAVQSIDFAMRGAESRVQDESFAEESFFEYHLYTLGRPTTVRNAEQKQVTLLESSGFAVRKRLIYYGAAHYFRGAYGDIETNRKLGVFLEFENSRDNRMGMPLPAGVVRVYKNDGSGAQQFIGEDRIDHTPRDEQVTIRMGEAFDVLGSRKQMDFEFDGRCTTRSRWEIELRNHKDEDQEVRIVEPVGGEWSILQTSHEFTKVDQHTVHYDVNVPANEAVTVSYLIRVTWC